MLGIVHACPGTLDADLFARWQAHLCGVCLTLRDGSGQLSRVLNNTDAVLVSVLTEAQYPGPAARSVAGPCPLRGMRSAAVVPATDASVRLAATASLTLAAAKAADVVGEVRFGLGGHGRGGVGLRTYAAGRLQRPLRRRALGDGEMAAALGAVDLLTDLAAQPAIEARVRSGDPLDAVTAPTARACGRVFAASAVLAGRPANAKPLRAIGEAFGTLAHLLDAVRDLEDDRRAGAFNPVTATGTGLDEVRRRCADLVRLVRHGVDGLTLHDPRLVRALLVDGTHRALHTAFAAHPARTAAAHTAAPGPPPAAPGENPPEDPDLRPPSADPAPPPPPPEFAEAAQRRSVRSALLPWIGVYCTGYACCADHENPCTGRQHPAGCGNCGSGTDCGGCCDCCDCCGGDGCCSCDC